MNMKPGRNDPCSCGSGKKYKNCCLGKAEFHSPGSSAPTSNEMNQLDALFSTGRYAELESRARALLKLYSGSGVVWKHLSAALHMQGKDALQALRKAAELLPNDAAVRNNLGVVLQDLGQFDAASESCR